jgi:glutathione S-transferase
MIELIQIPYSPFCIAIRRILDYADARYKIVNVPNDDRTLIWRLTRGRYYQVPVIKDGTQVIFEIGEETQVVAKYLDGKFQLALFPHKLDGVQRIIWRYIENEVESFTFKLNDVHWKEVVPKNRAVGFVRHKERKFGRGCLDQWREQQPQLLEGLTRALIPFEEMLLAHPFLLEDRPRFLDFDLYGMLGNFLYSGHYELPAAHTRLREWYSRMDRI